MVPLSVNGKCRADMHLQIRSHKKGNMMVTQEQLAFIDLMSVLSSALGEHKRNELLKEDFSGLVDALEHAESLLAHGLTNPHLELVRHCLKAAKDGSLVTEYPTITALEEERARARARYTQMRRGLLR